MRFVQIVALVLVVLACQSEGEQRARHAERAAQFFEDKKWGEAKVEYLNLLQLDPTSSEANLRLADVHWELKEYGDALWRYRETVRLAPDDLDAIEKLATVLFFATRHDEARTQLDSVLEREPNRAPSLILSARLYAAANDMPSVLNELDRVIETADREDDAGRSFVAVCLAMKSQTLTHQEDFKGAERVLRQLVELQPRPASHVLLGVLLTQLDRDDEAVAAFRIAIDRSEKEEESVQSILALASFYTSRSRYAAAEELLIEARGKFPENETFVVRLGQLYQTQGETDKAAAMIEEIAASRPDDANPLLALAEFRRRLGQHDEALVAVDRALERDPKQERARLLRAEYLRERAVDDPKRAVEARQILADVLEDNPNSVMGLFTEAKFLLLDDKPEEAAHRLRRVVQDQPGSNAHYLLGNAYERMEQPDLARSEYLQALQLDAGNQVARTALASLYLNSGNRQLAVQEAEEALKRAPGDAFLTLIRAEGLIGLGRRDAARSVLDGVDFAALDSERALQAASMYVRIGETDRGRALIDTVLQNSPNDTGALRQLVALDAIGGDPKAGVERISAAIELEPERAELYELRATLYMGFRNKADRSYVYADEARKDLDVAIEKAPERPQPHLAMGNLLQGQGDSDGAVASLRRAIELDPTFVEAYVLTASIHERAGKTEQAIEVYEQLLEKAPDHALAKNNLAWLLADRVSASADELDRARRLAQEAKEERPEDASVADTLGYVMLKKDVPRAAIPLFREAVSNAANALVRASARYHLALAYEKTGESEKAIAELEIAIGEAQGWPEREAAQQTLQRLKQS